MQIDERILQQNRPVSEGGFTEVCFAAYIDAPKKRAAEQRAKKRVALSGRQTH